MADSKISALTSGGLVQAGDALVVARAGASLKVTPAGIPVLVFRYTVAGSDKASIDTGSDTPDAGSNDWTNGDLLEIFIAARTDDAVNAALTYTVTVNNDGTSIYDMMRLQGNNATAAAANSLGQAGWNDLIAHGTAGQASVASATQIVIPDYAGTTFNKNGTCTTAVTDTTAANNFVRHFALGYRSTSAIIRLKMAAAGTTKFKVGSQLLIYKRLAS